MADPPRSTLLSPLNYHRVTVTAVYRRNTFARVNPIDCYIVMHFRFKRGDFELVGIAPEVCNRFSTTSLDR